MATTVASSSFVHPLERNAIENSRIDRILFITTD
jgi:hypothetical protein